MSAFLIWFLEYRAFLNDADRAWQFFGERTRVFAYSTFLMFLILAFFTGITRRPAISVGIVTAIIIGVTYVHINKFHTRGAPLLPEDFQLATEAASLSKFINVWGLIRTGLAILLVLALSIALNAWAKKKFELDKNMPEEKWKRWAIAPRLIVIAIAVAAFIPATDFIRNHQVKRRENIEWLDTQFVAWNQVENYDKNGFLLGFLYNLQTYKLEVPEGYSEESIQKIRDRYSKIAKKENTDRISLADEDVSVIIVLNESFIDPKLIEAYYPYTGGDITPVLHSMQEDYPSGYMYSLDYGGGTANIEFETFTGLSNFWANTVPYTDILPKRGEIFSIASMLGAQDYKTTAIHPFNGSMYKRNIALANMGFKSFISESEMEFTERDEPSEYINDRAAYNEVLKELDSDEGNQLIALITMQNHMPYNEENYDQHDFILTDMEDAGRKSEIETYFQSLHNSDKYLGEFIEELENSEKKVLMLFYGDHSAGIFDRTNGHEDQAVRDLSRMMPYVVYSNFDMDNGGAMGLPTTTPNCMSNTMLDVVGAKKPAFYYLLDEVCSETPILAGGYYAETVPERTDTLWSYELVNYDMLGGKKFWMQQ